MVKSNFPKFKNPPSINLATTLSQNKVEISVKSKRTNALLDTGASITVASASFINKTSLAGTPFQPATHPVIKGVTGAKLTVLGVLTIPISIGGVKFSHPVHIIQDLHYPFILGLDFLNKHKARIDFNSQVLLLPDENSDVHNIHLLSASEGKARASSTVLIPKRSEMNIPVNISHIKNCTNVLLEPNPSLITNMQLIAARCLVQVDKGKAYLRVMNPTHSDVQVYARSILASVIRIDEQDVFAFESSQISSTPSTNTKEPELNFDLSTSDLTPKQKSVLVDFLYQHKDSFATNLSDLGRTDHYKHRIDTLPGTRPVRLPHYRTTPQNLTEIDRQVQELLQNDIIEPSNSEWHSPVLLVKKPTGEYRFVVDYRKLNKSTIPMSFPLPQLEDVFDSLGAASPKYFSSLDLKSGFWQLEMDPSTKHKAAFITQSGVYEWKRMPFGLMNAPISFQTLMTSVLRGIHWKFVLCYIDDILIFSPTFEVHLKHLQEVFARLRQANLKLQPSKCHFALQQLKFLGHIITREGVEVDPAKTDSIRQYPTPTTQKQVRSFLGRANYYRKFIEGFSKIAAPLNALLAKNQSLYGIQSVRNRLKL